MNTSIAIIVVAIILVLLYIRAKTEKEVSESRLETQVENDTLILVHGDYETIKKTLSDFCKLYNHKSLKIRPRLIEYDSQRSFVTFPYDIDFENLCFLHNYLIYPKNMTGHLNVMTWCTAKKYTNWVHEKMLYKKIQLYVLEEDTNYDNVYAITENNDCFKIDFASGISETENISKVYASSIVGNDILKDMPSEDVL